MHIPSRLKTLSFSVLFICLLISGCALYTEAPSRVVTPEQVVLAWNKFYGKDMNKAAKLTTLAYRGNKSEAAWAKDKEKNLESVQYKRLDGRILRQKIDNGKAQILVQAQVETVDGKVSQKELYLLKQSDSRWLIDKIIVRQE